MVKMQILRQNVPADVVVSQTPWLEEVEAQWGPAPGLVQADGRGIFIWEKSLEMFLSAYNWLAMGRPDATAL